MSWRAPGGIAAARRRHEVIMTPSTYLYFDKKATDSYHEPVSLSSSLLPLEIYGYDPDEGDRTRRPALPAGRTGQPVDRIHPETRRGRASLPAPAAHLRAGRKSRGRPSSASRGGEFSRCAFRPTARIDASGEPYRLPAPLGIEDGTSEGEKFLPSSSDPRCPAVQSVRYTLNGAVPQDFDREMPRSSTSRFLRRAADAALRDHRPFRGGAQHRHDARAHQPNANQ